MSEEGLGLCQLIWMVLLEITLALRSLSLPQFFSVKYNKGFHLLTRKLQHKQHYPDTL